MYSTTQIRYVRNVRLIFFEDIEASEQLTKCAEDLINKGGIRLAIHIYIESCDFTGDNSWPCCLFAPRSYNAILAIDVVELGPVRTPVRSTQQVPKITKTIPFSEVCIKPEADTDSASMDYPVSRSSKGDNAYIENFLADTTWSQQKNLEGRGQACARHPTYHVVSHFRVLQIEDNCSVEFCGQWT